MSELPIQCPDCLHPVTQHLADGCGVRDGLGNRCACVQAGP